MSCLLQRCEQSIVVNSISSENRERKTQSPCKHQVRHHISKFAQKEAKMKIENKLHQTHSVYQASKSLDR